MLVRRNQTTGALAFYRCYTPQIPQIVPLLLVVMAANEHADRPSPAGMILLTCSEIRRLSTILVVTPPPRPNLPRVWSTWRRRHQHRA